MRLHSVPARFGVAAGVAAGGRCATWPWWCCWPRCRWCTPASARIYLAGVAAIGLLLVYEHWLVRPDDLTPREPGLFPRQRRGEHRAVAGRWSSWSSLGECRCEYEVLQVQERRNRSLTMITLSIRNRRSNTIREKVARRRAALGGRGGVALSTRRSICTPWASWPTWSAAARTATLAYYNINAHLNPTNVCVYRCPFCAFAADAGDPRAYVMGDEQILARGQEAVEQRLHRTAHRRRAAPSKDFDWYLSIIRSLHAAFPRLHLKAWTAVEIVWFAQQARPAGQGDPRRADRGRAGQPAGRRGRDLRSGESRGKFCPHKADAGAWLDIHRTAHASGLRTNATMLYGHLEKAAPADRSPGAACASCRTRPAAFRPSSRWRFIPRTRSWRICTRPSALMDLRTMAVSRLMLDNFDHVKAYWISLGVGTAQSAWPTGPTIWTARCAHEQIHHDAGGQRPRCCRATSFAG